MANLPWVADGITETEEQAIEKLSILAARDPALARLVASLPWVADGINETEEQAIEKLSYIAYTDSALAHLVASLPLGG